MQTLTRTDKVVINNYHYMTILDETNTSIGKFYSRPYAPLLYIYLYVNFLESLFR
jgi:hypothetical protein